MSSRSRIRHSTIGRVARRLIHAVYKFRHLDGRPVRYRLAAGIECELYPEGDIVEFLSLRSFFERTEMALTAAYLKPGMRVLDVGANIGVYSILAQKCVGESGLIWAFEPSIQSYQRLVKNIELNKCKKVNPIRMALGDRPDTYVVLQSDPGFGDSYRYVSAKANGRGEIVPATTLDSYALREGITNVDYIKLDVEGCEQMVFNGAQELLASNPNVVIMFESEVDWCERAGYPQQNTFKLLQGLDFKLYVWNNRKRLWKSDEASLLASPTVWATRTLHALPIL